MKIAKLLMALSTGALLVGCATAPATDEAAKSNRPELDSMKMYFVEEQAKNSGTKVIWINPPEKKDD